MINMSRNPTQVTVDFSDPENASSHQDALIDNTNNQQNQQLFEPYNKGDASGRLLTGMQKVTELEQLLEERNLQMDEMRVEMNNQQR